MVGEDIDYVVVESDHTGTTERYLLAEARLRGVRPRARRGAPPRSSAGTRAPTWSG